MWKYVQSAACVIIVAALSACGGAGHAVPPVFQTQMRHTAFGPRFVASPLPQGFDANAIMRGGQIVGEFEHHAAILKDGRVTTLPLLPGASAATARWVNSRGDAVGYTEYTGLPHPLVATLYIRGVARNLDPQAPPRQAESADVIGEQGQIYGTSDPEDWLNSLDLVRFLPEGGLIHLNPVNGERAAGFIYDINNAGIFAGYEWPQEIPFNLGTHAMTGENLTITLTQTDFFTSVNTAIDNAGDVAGYVDPSNSTFDTSGKWTAFVRTRGGATMFIPSLAGSTNMQPTGINNRGDVVGISQSAEFAAAFYLTHGAVYDVGSRSTPAMGDISAVMHGLSDQGTFVVRTVSGYYAVRELAGR